VSKETLERAKAEFLELDHAYQLAFATGDYRFIKTAEEARKKAFLKFSKLHRKFFFQNNK